MNLKVSTSKEMLDPSTAIVYLLELDIDGKTVVKIGMTTRKIEDRVLEILLSCFKQYREFPRCRPKRFKKTIDAYGKEQLLLRYFSDYKYTSGKVFGGCQELVDVPLDVVVDAYERVLNGEELDGSRYNAAN